MTAHGTNADTDPVDRNRAGVLAEDLVGFRLSLPFLSRLTAVQLRIDVGNQATCQWHAKVLGRKRFASHCVGNFSIDVKDCGRWSCQFVGDAIMCHTHLLDQLSHVVGTGSRRCLVGHRRHPLDQARFV